MIKINFHNLTEPAINDDNLNQMQDNIEAAINAQVSGDTLPVGCIVPFTSDTVPENWLLCDGSAVSRTEYSLLFSVIGTSYGVGDGSTTFNLPNLKGRVAVGKDSTQTEFDNLGETGGEKTHTLTIDEMPSHNHSVPIDSFYNNDRQTNSDNGGGHISNITQGTNYHTNNRGGGQPHNILQPYQVTNFIIKAYQSAGIVATVVDNLNSTSTTDALSANQGRMLKRKVATAVLATETTMNDGVIPLDSISSTTSLLTLSNNGIRIGAGISKILISANAFFNVQGDNNTYSWTQIRQNDSGVSTAITTNINWFSSTVHSPRMINVQEGDIINLYKLSNETTIIRTESNTYLTVEVVE